MRKSALKIVAGFAVLFLLYHAAEYMILFKNSAAGFLGFQALFFVAAYLIARWQRQVGLSAWGLDIKKRFATHLLLGMFMGILLYGSAFLLCLLLQIEKVVQVPALADAAVPLGLFIFGGFFSSLSEDVLTRGYVYHHLHGKVRNGLLAVISAAIYLFNHIYRLDDGPVAYLYLFLLGVLFIIPLLLTKRLWFTGSMHWAGNVVFYYTHEIIKTEEASGQFGLNHVLMLLLLLFIPLNYFVLKAARMINKNQPGKQMAF